MPKTKPVPQPVPTTSNTKTANTKSVVWGS
jgi:hypothetical protein